MPPSDGYTQQVRDIKHQNIILWYIASLATQYIYIYIGLYNINTFILSFGNSWEDHAVFYKDYLRNSPQNTKLLTHLPLFSMKMPYCRHGVYLPTDPQRSTFNAIMRIGKRYTSYIGVSHLPLEYLCYHALANPITCGNSRKADS